MLNGTFLPRFGDNVDDFYGSPYRRSFGGYNPRRAETERYNQWKQQEQLRQREEEAFRRKRAQAEYFQRIHEAERQEKLRRQRMAQNRPAYSVVRGPDGRLYRVPVEHDGEAPKHVASTSNLARRVPRNVSPPTKQPKISEQPTFVRGTDGRVYQVQKSDDESTAEESSENEMETQAAKASPVFRTKATDARVGMKVRPSHDVSPSNTEGNVNVKVSTNGTTTTDTSTPSTKNTCRRVTVIVENVPDNEDETKTIWRNRRPGPGESWMEPIEP